MLHTVKLFPNATLIEKETFIARIGMVGFGIYMHCISWLGAAFFYRFLDCPLTPPATDVICEQLLISNVLVTLQSPISVAPHHHLRCNFSLFHQKRGQLPASEASHPQLKGSPHLSPSIRQQPHLPKLYIS